MMVPGLPSDAHSECDSRYFNIVLTLFGMAKSSRGRWGRHAFPSVSGTNLDRQELEFPRDFGGELNLLFVPFLQEQQTVVNTWIPFAETLEAETPGLVYYELPTIHRMPVVSRTFINEGMRAGIPDPKARERTVTLYIDLDEFMQATEIAGKENVHTMLVNRKGEILWRTVGSYDEMQGDQLREVVAKYSRLQTNVLR